MSLRELGLLFLMALIWGGHFSIIKVTTGGVVDPVFYAAIRMTIVALLLAPLLRIHKGQMRYILLAGVCLGGLNYAFMFSGIYYSNASVSAITMELVAPFTMILSVIFLKERVGLLRVLSFAFAFTGIIIIITARQTDGMGPSPLLGSLLLISAACIEAFGAISIKKVRGIKPFQLLAWFALVGSCVLWTGTLVFETDQLAVFRERDIWPFILALVYSVVLASLVGQATYYWLLSRLPANLVACSTLLVAFLAVIFGVVFLSEPLSWQLFVGGIVTLTGTGVILLRAGNKTKAASQGIPGTGKTK
ncbi:DMT family transporter [Parvularcula sp. IMCC14364]|uniref:DMT family transporter n=1 Tax=Parvularcula sp. IMCC14364 TaxID=3067902 RepID=UPI0027404075|nr:DMT family transporter [Parvularcula sp. IMCC14364]